MNDSVPIRDDLNDILAKVEELQIRLSFQEDSVQSLNDVIAKQDETIRQLQEQLRYFAKKVKTVESSVGHTGINVGDERPPHY